MAAQVDKLHEGVGRMPCSDLPLCLASRCLSECVCMLCGLWHVSMCKFDFCCTLRSFQSSVWVHVSVSCASLLTHACMTHVCVYVSCPPPCSASQGYRKRWFILQHGVLSYYVSVTSGQTCVACVHEFVRACCRLEMSDRIPCSLCTYACSMHCVALWH